MKKLIIAIAAVTVAVVANAATVKWSAGNVYEVGTTTKAGSSYMAFFVNSATLDRDTMLSTYVDASGNIDLSFLATTSAASGYSAAFTSNATSGAGTGASLGGTLTTTAGNSEAWTGYLVIIDATSADAAQHAFVTAETSKSTGANGQAATLSFTSNTGTQTADNWYAVPEPTSGLLMLLGVAGLALRRRRA